jgi:hypothetical protein
MDDKLPPFKSHQTLLDLVLDSLPAIGLLSAFFSQERTPAFLQNSLRRLQSSCQ